MYFDKKQFVDIDSSVNKIVEMGDGNSIKVSGIGKVLLEACNGQEWLKTELNDVLFIPQFKINLFSVAKALDKGFWLKSDKNKSELVDKTGRVRATAVREGKFFKMTFKKCEPVEKSFCNLVETVTDWHSKLVHINFNAVKKHF